MAQYLKENEQVSLGKGAGLHFRIHYDYDSLNCDRTQSSRTLAFHHGDNPLQLLKFVETEAFLFPTRLAAILAVARGSGVGGYGLTDMWECIYKAVPPGAKDQSTDSSMMQAQSAERSEHPCLEIEKLMRQWHHDGLLVCATVS